MKNLSAYERFQEKQKAKERKEIDQNQIAFHEREREKFHKSSLAHKLHSDAAQKLKRI
ncbi:hypothetical protein [Bernardetia sp.]|uniref:hypothetical protein n=1 Tax=Bernardetia sp. TaxID=1937974 RepID=UPI0025BBD10A|nr:hypothetical protein [Bernardetia sp.]